MSRCTSSTQQAETQYEPQFSVIAMMMVDRARRQGIDPASLPVRELDARAERLIDEAGGFSGLVAEFEGSAP